MARTPKAAPPAPASWLERAITSIAPSWALQRHQARNAIALSGGYAGAGYSERFAGWNPGVRDADGDTVRDLRQLRARSRDLVRNSPIAAGAVETQVSHVVGSGLSLQSRIDGTALGLDESQAEAWQNNTERRFALWASSVYCDAAEELDFYEQQALALRTQIESGDAFTVLPQIERQGWPFRLALQIVEADRACNPNFNLDTDTLTAGIERSPSGAAIAVHLCSHHPGSVTAAKGLTWARVPFRGAQSGRRNVLHLKRKLRPGQTRGLPELAPIIGTLKQMERYSIAEIDAAVNSAAQAVFVKMDPQAFDDLFNAEAQSAIVNQASGWDGNLSAGRAINLLPGESIDSPALGRPNPNFDPFMSAFMRFVGMGLNIPCEVLTKHFQSSYSAARAALLDAWRTFSARRQWLAAKWCQPIYEEWLADEVAAGNIQAPGFFADPLVRAAWCAASWSGDGPGALDPLKEVNAAEKRMQLGITTLAAETLAANGGDWRQNHRQRAIEVRERIEAGLEAPVTAPNAAPAMPGTSPPQQAAPGAGPEDEPVTDPTSDTEDASASSA